LHDRAVEELVVKNNIKFYDKAFELITQGIQEGERRYEFENIDEWLEK
jgi:hypothetical protein